MGVATAALILAGTSMLYGGVKQAQNAKEQRQAMDAEKKKQEDLLAAQEQAVKDKNAAEEAKKISSAQARDARNKATGAGIFQDIKTSPQGVTEPFGGARTLIGL